jgi:hypothetical protein
MQFSTTFFATNNNKKTMISSLLLLVSAALAQESMTSSAPALVLGYPTQLDITSKAQPCELQVTCTVIDL